MECNNVAPLFVIIVCFLNKFIYPSMQLIQLVTDVEVQEGDHLLLHPKFKYAFEQNPYIEEPRPTFSTCSHPASLDLRPLIRHNFELQSKETVDDYWKTLEYLYSAADQTAAAHAFPGSSVPEVCNVLFS